jgi:hypothetical protein
MEENIFLRHGKEKESCIRIILKLYIAVKKKRVPMFQIPLQGRLQFQENVLFFPHNLIAPLY